MDASFWNFEICTEYIIHQLISNDLYIAKISLPEFEILMYQIWQKNEQKLQMMSYLTGNFFQGGNV